MGLIIHQQGASGPENVQNEHLSRENDAAAADLNKEGRTDFEVYEDFFVAFRNPTRLWSKSDNTRIKISFQLNRRFEISDMPWGRLPRGTHNPSTALLKNGGVRSEAESPRK